MIAHRLRVLVRPIVAGYIPIALSRVVPQFELDGFVQRAREIQKEEFEAVIHGAPPTEDFDGSDAAEIAAGRAQEYYDTMVGMRHTILNLLAVGLFHMLEQQLAELATDATFQALGAPAPPAELEKIAEWYPQHVGLKINGLKSWATVRELGFLANTVKHGDGSSADRLKEQRPELFVPPSLRRLKLGKLRPPEKLRAPLAGEGVYVEEAHLKRYGEAAVGLLDAIADYFDDHAEDDFPLPPAQATSAPKP